MPGPPPVPPEKQSPTKVLAPKPRNENVYSPPPPDLPSPPPPPIGTDTPGTEATEVPPQAKLTPKQKTVPQSSTLSSHTPSKAVKNMQEWLGQIHSSLDNLLVKSDQGAADLVNNYVKKPNDPNMTLIARLSHLVGLGRTEKDQSDGIWGDKTQQALKSIGWISGGLLDLTKKMGEVGTEHFSTAEHNDLINLITNKANIKDQNKRATEINNLLAKLDDAVKEYSTKASDAAKQIGQGIKAPVQDIGQKALNWITEKGASFKVPDLFVSLGDKKTEVPLSALQNLPFFAQYLHQNFGSQNIQPNQYKDIINQLIYQCQAKMQQQSPADKNPNYHNPGY